MALEFTEDFVKEQGLSPEQVTAIAENANTWHDSQVVELKGTFEGEANKNAEAILNGAAGKIATTTSVSRKEGEKIADYISRAWEGFSSAEKAGLATVKADYEAKLKDFDGDAGTKQELQTTKEALDALQIKTANYDDIAPYKEKYEALETEHGTMKEKVVFGNVKPVFPDTANEYEATAKWKDFVNSVKKDYKVELVDGESVAIDKENPHKTIKIKDLLAKNEEITALLAGRAQNGPNGKPVSKTVVEGIPFEVPSDLSSKDRASLIRTELLKTGLNIMSKEYSVKFAEYNDKIRKQQTAV